MWIVCWAHDSHEHRALFSPSRKHAYSKYIEHFTSKNWQFLDKKNSDIFSHFCSKQRLLVLVRTASRCGSNEYPQSMFLSRDNKNNVYPCKPQFYYIKVGFTGVKIYRYVFVMLTKNNNKKTKQEFKKSRLLLLWLALQVLNVKREESDEKILQNIFRWHPLGDKQIFIIIGSAIWENVPDMCAQWRFCPVLSESSLSVWIIFETLVVQNTTWEFSDHAVRMRRLIWVFAETE